MEHIIKSEVATQIRENNDKRIEEINLKLRNATRPLMDDIDQSERGDEVLYIYYYIRKGNDFITHATFVSKMHNHISASDEALAIAGMQEIIRPFGYTE